MNRIMMKMRSERGASITFALLAFLVCAVLSTVIIVASTTAAGRVSKLTETDKGYYSVTSAAEMLENILGNETVTILKEEKKTRTTTYNEKGEAEGPPVVADVPNGTKYYLVPGVFNISGEKNAQGKFYYEGFPITTNGAKKSVDYSKYGNSMKLAAYVALQYDQCTATAPVRKFNLELIPGITDGSILNADLDCTLTRTVESAQLKKDGSLIARIISIKEDKQGNKQQGYKLDMVYEADVKSSQDSIVVGEINPAENRNNNKVVEDLRIYEKTSIKWLLTEIETVK